MFKSMDIIQAETDHHTHLNNHAWQHMEGAWRLGHQRGLRVAQVTGSCDHIRLRTKCMAKQATIRACGWRVHASH